MTRLALAIVRQYPAAWRERYESEVSALIEDSPPTLTDLGELLRGLVTERARELVSSDDRPKRTAAVLTWVPAIFICLFTVLAIGLGTVLRSVEGPWSEAQQDTYGIAIMAFLTGLLLMHIVTDVRHIRRRPPKPRARLPAWAASLVLPLVFVAVVCAAWGELITAGAKTSTDWWLHIFARGYIYLMVLGRVTASLWPRRDLVLAFASLQHAEDQIRVNEAWVESCHEWNAKGVPSPLDDALNQVGYWTLERDAARARLQELGYRARFRTPSGAV